MTTADRRNQTTPVQPDPGTLATLAADHEHRHMGPTGLLFPPPPQSPRRPLSAAQGIALGILLGLPIWGSLFVLGWMLLGGGR